MSSTNQVSVVWTGNGPIIFRLPGRNQTYTFAPRVRNRLAADVWRELIDPTTGPASAYKARRMLRVTTAAGSTDEEVEVRGGAAFVPTAAEPAPVHDERMRVENAELRAALAEMRARMAAIDERLVEPPVVQEVEPEPVLNPANYSISKLTAAIRGMSAADLAMVLDAETNGDRRKGAIEAIETEQIVAEEREGDEG